MQLILLIFKIKYFVNFFVTCGTHGKLKIFSLKMYIFTCTCNLFPQKFKTLLANTVTCISNIINSIASLNGHSL